MPVEVTYLSVIKNPDTGQWVSGWLLPDGTFDKICFEVDFTLSKPLAGKTLFVEAYIDDKRIGDPFNFPPLADEDAKDYTMIGRAQLKYSLKGSLVHGHIFTLRFIFIDETAKNVSARFYTKEEKLPRIIFSVLTALAVIVGVGGAVYSTKRPRM